jgi:hypothetical protein
MSLSFFLFCCGIYQWTAEREYVKWFFEIALAAVGLIVGIVAGQSVPGFYAIAVVTIRDKPFTPTFSLSN